MGIFGPTIKIGTEKIGRKEFISRLEKGDGFLFKKIDKKSPAIGPNLTDDNKIMGDVLAVEISFFYMHSTKEQTEFYEQLQKESEQESYRYLLTITNSLDIWKQDIKQLNELLHELLKDEGEIKKEELDVSTLRKREELASRIPEVLKRHFPQVFEKIEKDYNDMDVLINDLKDAESKVHYLEEMIKNYLAKLRKIMPFLF